MGTAQPWLKLIHHLQIHPSNQGLTRVDHHLLEPMKVPSKILAVATAVLLSGCGGGGGGGDGGNDPNATSSGATFSATQGVFVAKGNFFTGFPQYYQIVLDGGETWIVNEYNAKSEPAFFATGKFQFAERIIRNTTTTTVTITPERTLTESAPETIDMALGAPVFSGNTYFKAKNALITINSNVLGTAEVTYAESFRPDLPLAESTRVSSPAAGQPVLLPGSRRGEAGSEFDYDRPANVQSVAGSYVFANGKFKVNMLVANSGAFSGMNEVSGCAFSGMLTPHPSGKNVFTVAVNVSNCQDTGSYTGVAGAYPSPDTSSGNGSMDFISPSGQKVPSLFIAAVDTKAGRVFSIAMARFGSQTN